jgi:hypothetical protein
MRNRRRFQQRSHRCYNNAVAIASPLLQQKLASSAVKAGVRQYPFPNSHTGGLYGSNRSGVHGRG